MNLLLPGLAVAASHGAEEKLTYIERMGLYADWAVILLVILAVVAFIKFGRK
jgi:hypothetical protein